MALPATTKVKNLNRRSEEWTCNAEDWDIMNLLYTGQIRKHPDRILIKRPKEPGDVYESRSQRFSYENHVGTAMDWYLAALFEKPPVMKSKSGGDEEFFEDFQDNCDRAGTDLIEHMRRHLLDCLLFGRAASLVDLPAPPDEGFANLQAEKDAGQDEPYLCRIDPQTIINMQRDQDGVLEWIIFYSRETVAPDPFSAAKTFDKWYYFDKKECAVYQREVPDNEKGAPGDDAEATLVRPPRPHAMTKQNTVPVIFTEVPEGLWLMNRAISPTRNHVNTGNALDWALMMSALAMPVVQMDGDYNVVLTEAGFIKLPFQSVYGWSEPEGKSHALLSEKLADLCEQIFRAFYLIAQARSTTATPAAQSGVSKQQDMAAPKKILNLYGDLIRGAMRKILEFVSFARGAADPEWEIQGFEFPEDDAAIELGVVSDAQALQIPSDTFSREVHKKAVSIVLPDLPQETKDIIYKEIDAAPTAAEKAEEERSARIDALTKAGMGGMPIAAGGEPNVPSK